MLFSVHSAFPSHAWKITFLVSEGGFFSPSNLDFSISLCVLPKVAAAGPLLSTPSAETGSTPAFVALSALPGRRGVMGGGPKCQGEVLRDGIQVQGSGTISTRLRSAGFSSSMTGVVSQTQERKKKKEKGNPPPHP